MRLLVLLHAWDGQMTGKIQQSGFAEVCGLYENKSREHSCNCAANASVGRRTLVNGDNNITNSAAVAQNGVRPSNVGQRP